MDPILELFYEQLFITKFPRFQNYEREMWSLLLFCIMPSFLTVQRQTSFDINEVEMMTSNLCVTSSVEDGRMVHENDTTMPGALT